MRPSAWTGTNRRRSLWEKKHETNSITPVTKRRKEGRKCFIVLVYFIFMVRWVVGSILHGVDPLSYFSFQPVLHDWCNKGCGMCYPVCGMGLIKEPLLLIGKRSPCGGSGFPLSISEWSFTISPTPHNRKIKCVECIIK